jgi:hypothetical protein
MDKIFCCDGMLHAYYTSTIKIIGERDLKDEYRLQKDHLEMNPDYKMKKLKLGQVFLFNDEFGTIEGEPFNSCPWCGIML